MRARERWLAAQQVRSACDDAEEVAQKRTKTKLPSTYGQLFHGTGNASSRHTHGSAKSRWIEGLQMTAGSAVQRNSFS